MTDNRSSLCKAAGYRLYTDFAPPNFSRTSRSGTVVIKSISWLCRYFLFELPVLVIEKEQVLLSAGSCGDPLSTAYWMNMRVCMHLCMCMCAYERGRGTERYRVKYRQWFIITSALRTTLKSLETSLEKWKPSIQQHY